MRGQLGLMIGGLVILNIIIAGVAIALGLFLLFSRGRDKLRILFGLLNITTSVWVLANYFGDPQMYSLVLVDYVSGSLLALLFWLFSREMRKKAQGSAVHGRSPRNLSVVLACSSVAVLVAMILGGGVIVHSTAPTEMINNGPFYVAYPLMIFLLASFSLHNLLKAYTRSRDAVQKSRARLILAGLLIAFAGIAIPNLVLENILHGNSQLLTVSYEMAYIGILTFLMVTTYAIIKHGLFDIKLVAVRGVVYGGVLVSLSAIYYLAAYVFTAILFQDSVSSSVSVSPFNIALALVLAFLFQPFKSFFDRVTNKIFYRNSYETGEFFENLSNLLSSTTELRGLLERSATEISTTLKSEQALFFLYYHNGTEEHYMSAGTTGHARLPLYDARKLDEYSAKLKEKIFMTDMLPDDEDSLRRMLVSYKISLVMPLWHQGVVMGYVLLGDHLSGIYTKRDLQVLQTISNELVIAIQNALSLHALKELNATLQQRINVATKELRASNNQLKHLDEVKDEFISMASHQLRTPLTSVKGYLSMVLDGDVGKVTPRQQTLLREAFNSSERMVRLIADFLNVSRLQTGKFNIERGAIDIKAIIKQEMASLGLIAKTHDIKFRFKITDVELPLIADESKIQQVVMNLLDNAIYYSHPKSTVVVSLEKVKKDVAFTVVDTGIGVPHKDQPKLFQKFYRAKNARHQRPDGTGVGLFMARRVVEAHNGKIIFSSKEGRGSTFGFTIPMGQPDIGTSDDASTEDVAKK